MLAQTLPNWKPAGRGKWVLLPRFRSRIAPDANCAFFPRILRDLVTDGALFGSGGGFYPPNSSSPRPPPRRSHPPDAC